MRIASVHIVEAGGQGGIYQHSVAMASALHALGIEVTLHTAADSELDEPTVKQCRCFHWSRRPRSRRVRQAATTMRVFTQTLPHLRQALRHADVVSVQGLFGLTPEIIRVGRMTGAAVVCSPHNTFARDHAIGNGRALKSVLRLADRVLVFSGTDADRVTGYGLQVGVVPLIQWVPSFNESLTTRWRTAFRPEGRQVALLAGHVRNDKRPDLFVRALSTLSGWCGAIVGEDKGAGEALDALIAETGAPVTTHYGYFPLNEFAAAISAADVVVAPYAIASQSGVLSLSRSLGIPTAVTPVGGLSELATAVSVDDSPAQVGLAILRAAESGAETPTATQLGQIYLDQFLRSRKDSVNP